MLSCSNEFISNIFFSGSYSGFTPSFLICLNERNSSSSIVLVVLAVDLVVVLVVVVLVVVVVVVAAAAAAAAVAAAAAAAAAVYVRLPSKDSVGDAPHLRTSSHGAYNESHKYAETEEGQNGAKPFIKESTAGD